MTSVATKARINKCHLEKSPQGLGNLAPRQNGRACGASIAVGGGGTPHGHAARRAEVVRTCRRTHARTFARSRVHELSTATHLTQSILPDGFCCCCCCCYHYCLFRV